MLAQRLDAAKLRTIVTREPGGSPGAEIIRHLVLSGMGKLWGGGKTLLFAAARDDHVRSVIQPALEPGQLGAVRPFLEFHARLSGPTGQRRAGILNAMERVTIGDLKPDLTIILDVPVEIGMQRAAARRGNGAPDRFEAEDVRFHQELREAYRQIAADEPQRCVLIDARLIPATVAASVWTVLSDRLLPTPAGTQSIRMSARQASPDHGPASARNQHAIGPSRGRSGAAERLSQWTNSTRLVDRRSAGHRQGDTGLPDGAVRARAPQSSRRRCAARQKR